MFCFQLALVHEDSTWQFIDDRKFIENLQKIYRKFIDDNYLMSLFDLAVWNWDFVSWYCLMFTYKDIFSEPL